MRAAQALAWSLPRRPPPRASNPRARWSPGGCRDRRPLVPRADGAADCFQTRVLPGGGVRHGFAQNSSRHPSTLAALAARGYVVIAADSETGLLPNHGRFADDLVRAIRWARANVANAHPTLDAVAGHSMGGGAAPVAADRNCAIDTVATLAAAETRPSATIASAGVTVPGLFVVGDRDTIVGPATTRAMYDRKPAPARYVTILGGYHCGCNDSTSFFGIGCGSGAISRSTQLANTAELLGDWLDSTLGGSDRAGQPRGHPGRVQEGSGRGPGVHDLPVVGQQRPGLGFVGHGLQVPLLDPLGLPSGSEVTVPTTTSDERRIRAARMASLLLADRPSGGRTVSDVVEWFGAMQGQDFPGLLWSLGLRTGQTRAQVQAGFGSGVVLRTWPMRGTLHVVPGADARWMLEHLGARALRAATVRRTSLGLSGPDADRAADVLGEALAGGGSMTRAECVAVLEAAGIPGAGQRAYHLLWYASQKGVTCVGPQRGSEQTFVLLDEFAPTAVHLDRATALATIAARFVRSHAPVSEHDLARWADLTLTDARAGLAAAQGVLRRPFPTGEMFMTEEQLDSALADAAGSTSDGATVALPARALPGFDELILGYRDRTAQIVAAAERRVVPGGNGFFNPTLVLGGRVVGMWKRRELARTVAISATPLTRIRVVDRRRLDRALEDFAMFVGKPSRISWSDQEVAEESR